MHCPPPQRAQNSQKYCYGDPDYPQRNLFFSIYSSYHIHPQQSNKQFIHFNLLFRHNQRKDSLLYYSNNGGTRRVDFASRSRFLHFLSGSFVNFPPMLKQPSSLLQYVLNLHNICHWLESGWLFLILCNCHPRKCHPQIWKKYYIYISNYNKNKRFWRKKL